MDTTWAGTRYRTRLVHDDAEGWSAVELEPESWLLKVGWKRAPMGLIAIDECPPASRWN